MSASVGLRLAGVTKRYADSAVVDDLTLDVSAGSLTALLGPSGCGKSTTLAMIGGLVVPDAGDVLLGGKSVLGTPAERRPIATVFQKPLLFPHLDVAANVGFGLRMRGRPRAETRRAVEAMLERVELAGFGDRRVGELSGGQEQRVALARALVLDPQVLLLDEPFSQLDTALRAGMRRLVLELHRDSGLTTVFVTHDQGEAMEVADRVALMIGGHLESHASPQEIYRRPASLVAARFLGLSNEIDGVVRHGSFHGPGRAAVPVRLPDGPAVLVARPEELRLSPSGLPTEGDRSGTVGVGLDGVVISARFAGTHLSVLVRIAEGATLTVHAPADASVTLGNAVQVLLPTRPAVYPPG